MGRKIIKANPKGRIQVKNIENENETEKALVEKREELQDLVEQEKDNATKLPVIHKPSILSRVVSKFKGFFKKFFGIVEDKQVDKELEIDSKINEKIQEITELEEEVNEVEQIQEIQEVEESKTVQEADLNQMFFTKETPENVEEINQILGDKPDIEGIEEEKDPELEKGIEPELIESEEVVEPKRSPVFDFFSKEEIEKEKVEKKEDRAYIYNFKDLHLNSNIELNGGTYSFLAQDVVPTNSFATITSDGKINVKINSLVTIDKDLKLNPIYDENLTIQEIQEKYPNSRIAVFSESSEQLNEGRNILINPEIDGRYRFGWSYLDELEAHIVKVNEK